MGKLLLYYRTLRYLKISQHYYLVKKYLHKKLYSLYPSFYNEKLSKTAANKLTDVNSFDFGSTEILNLLLKKDRVVVKDDGKIKFTFLHQSIEIDDNFDWSANDKSFLWNYNLHCFEYAFDLGLNFKNTGEIKYYNLFKSLSEKWIQNYTFPNGEGNDAYPTSLRIVAWIKAFHFFKTEICKDEDFKNLFLQSLFKQTLLLEKNIEHHLLNNHGIENARALYFAGVFFNGGIPKRWIRKGESILLKEMKRQVLNDGAQFELSPMYHAVVMLIYLDYKFVCQSIHRNYPHSIDSTLDKMFTFYKNLQLSDGEIAFFNDAATGVTVSSENLNQIFELAGLQTTKETEKLVTLKNSGFYIINDAAENAKLIFDAGLIGPDFQPGHGHCDCLSFVFALHGKRIFIDSGVDDYYGDVRWREYFRSTRAHNTVMINDIEQSEIWGNFRVARRAYPQIVDIKNSDDMINLSASHDGYTRLTSKTIHTRNIKYKNKNLQIIDQIKGKTRQNIKVFFHIHPQFTIKRVSEYLFEINDGETTLEFEISNIQIQSSLVQGQESPLQAWHCHEYGKKSAHTCIVLEQNVKESEISVNIRW